MRKRAAHEGDVLHPGEAKIRDELPAAAHQAIVFLADEARSDALPCRHKLLQADRANGARSSACGRPGTLRSGGANERHRRYYDPNLRMIAIATAKPRVRRFGSAFARSRPAAGSAPRGATRA